MAQSGGSNRARTTNAREAESQDAGSAAPELSIDESAGSLGIGLKDDTSPGKSARAGMRSPLVDKSAAPRPQHQHPAPSQQQQRPSRAATGRRPGSRPGDKAAPFDQAEGTKATALRAYMVDRSPRPGELTLKVIIVGGIMLFAFLMIVMPAFRSKVITNLGDAKDAVVGVVRYQKKTPVKKRATTETQTQQRRVARSDEASPPKSVATDCRTLQMEVGSGGTFSLEERVRAAECFLLDDSPARAEDVLAPLRREIAKTPEAKLNAEKKSLGLVAAMHLLVLTELKQGDLQSAEALVKQRCQKWQPTHTCTAKLTIFAERKMAQADFEVLNPLFAVRNQLGGRSEALLWLAGAKIAALQARPASADQRYAIALLSAPKDALALRREIYEAQAVDLYKRNEWIKLKNLTSKAKADLQKLDGKAKTKLAFLANLLSESTRKQVVKKALGKGEVIYRARSDFELVEILGLESLRQGQEDAYVQLLKKTSAYLTQQASAAPAPGKPRPSFTGIQKKIATWEIRAKIAQGKGQEAVDKLALYDQTYGADVQSKHLRGVVYLSMTDSAENVVIAAKAFQDAVKLGRNWESLYALGVALIRAGKSQSVAAVIKDMEQLVRVQGQRYWLDMLKAEWYLSQSKFVSAQKILSDWAARETDFRITRELLAEVHTKLGNKAEADKAEREAEALKAKRRYLATVEGGASPLGAFALESRPLD